MKIPFFSSMGAAKDYFFGLLLKENKGMGCIIAGDKKKLTFLAKKEFSFSNGWEGLVEDVDDVLFKLENETTCRIEKTIFFLYSHLVDDKIKEIKKPQLQKIKELTKNLEIKPLGYIECFEAVATYLQAKEGMPLTSILIELDEKSVDVFIYKGGHKMHNYVVSRTDNIIDDLHAVFDVVGKNTLLPNRLILYNSSHLMEESTKIISHKWSSDLFVQLPRVEILKEDQLLEGLLSVFEQQVYAAPIKEESVRVGTEVMGFVIGKDVSENAPNTFSDSAQEVATPKQSIFQHIKDFIHRLLTVQKPPFSFRRPNKMWVFIVMAVILLCGSLFAFENFLHKATVSLFFPSVPLVNQLTVPGIMDEQKPDFITVHSATSSVAMKDVKITTGKRDIGQNAKGEVTLYNFDDTDKTFTKGTIIQVDNLRFTLDHDVKVASSTLASDASAKLPGKSKAEVTATDLGPESNIDKGKRFKIADLSTSVYFAMNEVGFTGGTRKSVKTVSKKDMDDLKNSILQKAKDQLKQEIYEKKNQQVTLLDQLINFNLSNVVFSKELGEEGDNLSLQANVVAGYRYFDTGEMNMYLKNAVSSEVPSGYQLETQNMHFKIDSAKQDASGITMKLSLNAKATKSVDVSKLTDNLRFISVSQAGNVAKKEYGATSSTIEVRPSILLVNTILPFFKKNIEIHIESL